MHVLAWIPEIIPAVDIFAFSSTIYEKSEIHGFRCFYKDFFLTGD